MRKIKVLIIHRTLSMLLGGGELFFVRLIRSLTKSNVDIDFITAKPFFRKINCVYKDLNVKYVKSPYLWSLAQIHLSRYIDPLDEYCFKFQLFRFLRKNIKKYDIILVYHYTRIAKDIKITFNKPVIYVSFGYAPCENNIRFLDKVLTNGAGLDIFKKFGNVVNIPIGIDNNLKKISSNIREEYQIKNDDFVILFVGRITYIKNLPFLIQGFNEFNKIINNSRLIIVGSGELLNKYNHQDNRNIIFTGSVSQEVLNKFYSTADVFTLCSFHECLPLTIDEAKAYSLPIVATRVGGMIKQVKHGKGGFLIDHNVNEFVDSMLKLYKNNNLRKNMGDYNKKSIKSQSWNKSANIFANLCESLINQKNKTN